MDRPLEIAFHHAPASDWAEQQIREHVDKLARRFPHLTGCRVSVEGLHHQHQHGNVYDVHVVLSVPGRDLAVSHEPKHLKEKAAHTDLAASIREAFRAAERQLLDYKGRLSEDTTPPSGSALAGRIEQLPAGADHGYLANAAGALLYFHRDSVTNGRFEALRVGDVVHYVEEEGDAGPVAAKIRVP